MAEDNAEDTDLLVLGGNIELAGFKDLDPASMVVVKKIVGNYAKRISGLDTSFEKLKLTMKSVHERESSKLYEIRAMVQLAGKPSNSEVTDRNIFVALSQVLEKAVSGLKLTS